MNYNIPFFNSYSTFSECIQYLQLCSLAKHFVLLIFCCVEKGSLENLNIWHILCLKRFISSPRYFFFHLITLENFIFR